MAFCFASGSSERDRGAQLTELIEAENSDAEWGWAIPQILPRRTYFSLSGLTFQETEEKLLSSEPVVGEDGHMAAWLGRFLLVWEAESKGCWPCALGKRIKGRQSDRVWARWLLDETRDLHCHWLPHQVKKVLEEKPYPGTTWVAGHFLGETEMLSLSITCNNSVKWLPRGTCPSPPSFNINYHSKICFVFFNSPTL